MKKLLIAFALILILFCFCGCENTSNVMLYCPDGAPAVAVSSIIGGVDDYNISSAITTGEDIVAKVLSREADVAVLPVNSAIKLVNASNEYKLFCITTTGNLFIVGKCKINSLAELSGKVLCSIGLGGTPQAVLEYLLSSEHINFQIGDSATEGCVTVKYYSQASELLPLVISGKVDYALIAEPSVSVLLNKASSKGVVVALNLQQEWQSVTGSNYYAQSAMLVKGSLLSQSGFASALEDGLKNNKQFINSNLADMSTLLANYGSSINLTYTEDVISRMGVNTVFGEECKNYLQQFVSLLGGGNLSMPSDNSIYGL